MTVHPPKLDEADERLTSDQFETFERDMCEHPGKVGLVGFNDAGWLCYVIGDVPVAVAPSGNAYTGRDAHLRRHEDEG